MCNVYIYHRACYCDIIVVTEYCAIARDRARGRRRRQRLIRCDIQDCQVDGQEDIDEWCRVCWEQNGGD